MVFWTLSRVQPPRIVVVSGLPRSGTSMMMQMLAAGGLSALTDGTRAADDDNPRGYYEFEAVKRLPQGDWAWLEDAPGRAVKVITSLLPYLPSTYRYDVLLMRRDPHEVARSQRAMLARLGTTGPSADDAALAQQFRAHEAEVLAWADAQPFLRVLPLAYTDALAAPRDTARRVRAFVQLPLDVGAMAAAVDATLYRQRRVGGPQR